MHYAHYGFDMLPGMDVNIYDLVIEFLWQHLHNAKGMFFALFPAGILHMTNKSSKNQR
jgi:hypothetical protein